MRDYGTTSVSGIGVVIVTSILVGGSLALAGDSESASPSRRSIAWPRPPALTKAPAPAAPLGLRLEAPRSITISPTTKVANDAAASAPVSTNQAEPRLKPTPKTPFIGPRPYKRVPRTNRHLTPPQPAGMLAWVQPRPLVPTPQVATHQPFDTGATDIAAEPRIIASNFAAAGPIAPQVSPTQALKQARALYATEILKPDLSGMNFTFVLDLLDAAIEHDTKGQVAKMARLERERVATTAAVARRYRNAMHEIARVLDD